ncbi:MAG: 1-deoxy-D-xylulose-5-phosphate synthase, partial [Firmicutes bacterium]|nr:1-deoxy-D-xylulose-5-phosphate synthase [Bacillota bacterium]
MKKLSDQELPQLASELRSFMVENVAKTGGHLAPSLGVVDLIIAMCRSFDFPKDRVIFDVGHQSYAYKILTGRKDVFHTLRSYDGISGFPKSEESEYDAFNTGHSSTSISAALGLAVARDLKKEDYRVIAVIGDGALTGGMAYEAMNNAGSRKEDLIVILNDNQMSISKNVGAMANYLTRVRTTPDYSQRKLKVKTFLDKTGGGKKVLSGLRRVRDSVKYLMVQGMYFEEMGFTYLGPIDGHDISAVEQHLNYCKNVKGPVLLHVLTRKGKGYPFAESEPDKFHGIAPFDPKTGCVLNKSNKPTFSKVFGNKLTELAAYDSRLLAITAAMPDGTGLTPFSQKYPDRFFDVGIAEPHAVTYAAALAKNDMRPCVAIYSSFLQRAVDQIYHDVCLQKLPVVFGIDRAGIVGEDGETHQGIYDISLLRTLPYITLLAPGTEQEMEEMLTYAFSQDMPCALRYARGAVSQWDDGFRHAPLELGKGELVRKGENVLLMPLGAMMEPALKAAALLEEQGLSVGVYNPRFIKPLDEDSIAKLAMEYSY